MNKQNYTLHAETEYEKYRVIQDRLFKSDFDLLMEELDLHTDSDNENKDNDT
jgi:hypothetical protein